MKYALKTWPWKNDIHDPCSICEPKHCQNILVTQIYQVHVYIHDHLHMYKETCNNKQRCICFTSNVSMVNDDLWMLDAHAHVMRVKLCKANTRGVTRLVQTVHLSCTDTNTVSERNKKRFHMTHVTKKFHRVRPKWFSSLWYVWCKLCTYLPSRLALFPIGPKWTEMTETSFHLTHVS